MTMIFPAQPACGWRKGDVAYCVRPGRETRPALELGRVYRVARVKRCGGLIMEGVKIPKGFLALNPRRFINLGPVGGRLGRIAAATRYKAGP